MEAEGVSRWVSRESEVKWQLDIADLSRSRVVQRAYACRRAGGRKSRIRQICYISVSQDIIVVYCVLSEMITVTVSPYR